MKESKGVYVTKRDIRENLLNRDYKLYNNNIVNTVEVNKYKLTNDVGIQYNSKRDNIFYTHKNLPNGKRNHDHDLRYFNPIPKQIFTYSRSFTDIGVGSVKALQKKKVKKIYLPETDDRGVGSADLTNFIVRMQSLQNKSKSKQYRTNQSYYESKRTSSKCVGGAVEYRPECLVSAKVSPIVHTQSGSTSPKDPGFALDNPKEIKDSKDIEIGTVVIEKQLVTTDTQFEEPEVEINVTPQVIANTLAIEPPESTKEVKKTPQRSAVEVIKSVDTKTPPVNQPSETKIKVVLPEKKYEILEPLKGSFSSDSLVQHVHNLEQPSEYSKQRDPMENKMEREYRKMFASISRDDKADGVPEKQIPQKSTSLFRRRFTAIRKSLGKKDSKNAMGQNENSVPSVRDASVTSDPPSLEERSFSSINGYPSKRNAQKKASYKKSYTGKKSSKTWSKANAVDSEYGQGVKGMFKLWGKKFNLDDTSDAKEDITQPSSFEDKPREKGEEPVEKVAEPLIVPEILPDTVIEEEKIFEKDKDKKEGKKFFFFKKRHSKDKTKNQNMTYKSKKGVTTGRCEVKDGLSLRMGAARPPSSKSRPSTPTSLVRKQISTPIDNDEALVRATWLMKYLSNPIESRNSVKIRWNNKTYTTSSSTIFELMGSVYKNTGVVLKSKSEITTEASSAWSYNRPNVNFVQQIEAWMVPKTIPDQELPVMMKNKSENHVVSNTTKRENEKKNIEVTISDQKWIIDNSKTRAHNIEVVLHSKNFVKLQKPEEAKYLRIDIPKGYFKDWSSDEPQPEHSSDEEVYNIVEYESVNSGPKLKQTQTSKISNSGDHGSESESVQVTVSVKSGSYEESKIMETVIKRPPMHRSVAIQGNDVYIPTTCDIIGVGIITQREMRETGPPIISVMRYLSDDDSEHSLPKALPNSSEFAKSYLQESYRNYWQSQYLGMFSWCVSDSHMQCCMEPNSWNSNNNGDASKSCPNIYEEYVTKVSSYSSGGCKNPKHPCYDDKKKSKIEKKPKKEKADKKEKEDTKQKKSETNAAYRVLPKDSLEVFKKRKIYALEKSRWIGDDLEEPYSVPSNADTGVQWKVDGTKKGGRPEKKNVKSNKKTAKISPDEVCTIPPSCCTKRSGNTCCRNSDSKASVSPCEEGQSGKKIPPMCPPVPPPAEGDLCPLTPTPCLSYKQSWREPHVRGTPDRKPASPSLLKNQQSLPPPCERPETDKSPPSPRPAILVRVVPPSSATIDPPSPNLKCSGEYDEGLDNKLPPQPFGTTPASKPREGLAASQPISCDDCCTKSKIPCYQKPIHLSRDLPTLRKDCSHYASSPLGSVYLMQNQPSPERSCQTKQSISPQRDKISPSGSSNSKSSRRSKQNKALEPDPCCQSPHIITPKRKSPILQRGLSNETQTLSTCPPSDKSPTQSKCSQSYNTQIPSPRKCQMGFKFSNSDCIDFPPPQIYPPKPRAPKQVSPQTSPPQTSTSKGPTDPVSPQRVVPKNPTDPQKPPCCPLDKPCCPPKKVPCPPETSCTSDNSPCRPVKSASPPKTPPVPPKNLPVPPETPPAPPKTLPSLPETRPVPPELTQDPPKTPQYRPKFAQPSLPGRRCPKGFKISNADNCDDADFETDTDYEERQDEKDDVKSQPSTNTIKNKRAPCCKELPCCPKSCSPPDSNSPKKMASSKQSKSPSRRQMVHHISSDCQMHSTTAKVQPLDDDGALNKSQTSLMNTNDKTIESPRKSSVTQESTVASEVNCDSCPEELPISVLKCKSAPLQCPHKDCIQPLDEQPKSQPNLEKESRRPIGIFLKKYPRKIDLSKPNVIRLNSKDKITFKLNDDDNNCMKIKDADNVTLVERKDYTKKTSKQTLLNNIYNDAKVNRVSTPITINNVSSVERENKIEESKSTESVVNVIEINFKLRVIQGDKTTEINIGNTDSKIITDDENHNPNRKKADHLDDRAKEVYIVKDEVAPEETNQKNDLNIRILIKNYKPKTESAKEKKAVDDFSQKISKKFNTVSTGYSIDLKGEHPDDTCFSVHRATIDLTTSNKSKENTSKEKIIIEGKKKGSDVKFKGCPVLSDEMLSHTLEDKTSVTENLASATEAESNLSITSDTVPINSIPLPTLSEHSKTESSRLSKHRSVQSISGMRYVFVDSKQPSSKNIEYLSSKSLNRSSRYIPRKWSRSDEGNTEKTFNTSESITFKNSKRAVVIKDLFKSQARLSFTDTDERDNSLGNKTSDEPTDLLGKTSDEHTDAVMKSSEDRTDHTDYGKMSEDPETDTKTSDLIVEKVPIEEVDAIDLGKSRKEQKKEMLKQVFDNVNYFKKPKTKNTIKKLKDMLKALLTSDETDSDTDHYVYKKVSKHTPKCAWDPKAKHNSDSLNNFFERGSLMVSNTALEENNVDSFQSNGSAFSEDDEKPKNKTCLCSNFAEKLNLGNIAGGGCCCRKMPEQVCEQVSCNFVNELVSLEDYSYFAPSVECVPCQTNNSRYKSSIHCAKIMSISSKKTSFITPQSGKTSLIEHSQGEPDNLIIEPLSTKVSIKSRKSELKDELKENSSREGQFLRKAEDSSETEPVSAKMSIRISKIERQVHEKCYREVRHQEYRKHSSMKTNAISEDDKVVYQVKEDKPEKSPVKREADKKRRHHSKIKNEADVLQMYETKKAVLEIYAEKTVTDDEEHFVANLPQFVRDTESQLYESYEHMDRNNYKRVYKRNFVMMCIGR